MLSPEEATPRALALITLAHELYAGLDDDPHGPRELDEDEVRAVLTDDDGDIDWQAIAVAMGMIAHVLLDIIPEKLYEGVEDRLLKGYAKQFGIETKNLGVEFDRRITGPELLRVLSLRVLAMDDGRY